MSLSSLSGGIFPEPSRGRLLGACPGKIRNLSFQSSSAAQLFLGPLPGKELSARPPDEAKAKAGYAFSSTSKFDIIVRFCIENQEYDIDEINTKLNSKGNTDVAGRVKLIYEKGCKLEYEGVQEPIFEGNLRTIDSLLPEIVAQMLLAKYRFRKSNFRDSVEFLTKDNPLKFKGSNRFYEIKIKRLLMACFTGMVAETVWNDYDDVHGGYIIVKSDGSVVCNHLSNRNQFEKYLFDRAYLDTPDVGRHKFASIERDDKGLVFKLNFSVRLKQKGAGKKSVYKKGQTSIGDY